MLITAMLVKVLIAFLVLVLMFIALVFVLRMIKDKQDILDVKNKDLKLINKLYIDSKTKIIKVKDDENVFTILLGHDNILLNKEKAKNENK